MNLKMKLGERMKKYENESTKTSVLNPNFPWIARLDGHCFHTFAKPFRKPFDDILNKIMVEVTKDLVNQYNATTGYTQSDEITLVFPAKIKESTLKPKQIFFAGRIIKISTVMAGFCSARFIFHSLKKIPNYPKNYEKYDKVIENINNCNAHFDCRIFNVPNDIEVLNNVIWRQRDCQKNSKTNLGRKYFTQKQINGKKSNEVVEKLKKELSVDYSSYPPGFTFGTFVKKELFKKKCIDLKTKQSKLCDRFRNTERFVDISKFDEKNVKFLISKYI